jgi:hypothetical protein
MKTYYHALGKDAIGELIEGYYRAFFDSPSEATDTDYTVETYTDQQASPGFRAEFLRTLERIEDIRWSRAHPHPPARNAGGRRNAILYGDVTDQQDSPDASRAATAVWHILHTERTAHPDHPDLWAPYVYFGP